ncbi:hypothetical protein FA15DRAFT_686985 [Coprinopsis marcescibilis]|uniref:N-alpha-acetyltransferase 60 n=1 Tax=Coprinopsis marcescibilis TaxID=230819 RepID=A0A5C3KYP6_COPMA|nr:hypothetical protein FA15DRAFT_686985 [Coprinopsis marcescibilis]
MYSIQVRPITSSDVRNLRQLHSQLLPLVTYNNPFFTQLLIMPNRHCLAAFDMADPTVPVGFISALVHNAPGSDYRSDREELDFLVDQHLDGVPKRRGGSGLSTNSDDGPSREPRIELLTLGVAPAYQHTGLARRFVRDMVARVQASMPKTASVAGLPPPSPLTPDDDRNTYFVPSAKKTVIVYANVATTNFPAINFYKRIGMNVLPGVRLDGLYRGQGQQASRLLNNTNIFSKEGNLGGSAIRATGMGNSNDAFVVAGLL